jgi:3-dehydroquinate dehydratase-2
MTRVYVLNGPNLNRLGTREPAIYGHQTYADLVALCEKVGSENGLDVVVRQTNAEGEMIDWVHQAADESAPVVLNAGAWTHYSYALRDACAMLTAPLLEVHISNVHKREEFRHLSVLSPVATGVLVGLGLDSYRLALLHLANH